MHTHLLGVILCLVLATVSCTAKGQPTTVTPLESPGEEAPLTPEATPRSTELVPPASLLPALSLEPEQNETPLASATPSEPVSVKQTVEQTLSHHQGLKILQENLDVVRKELRRAKAGWGPSVDATGSLGYSSLSNTTTRPLGTNKDFGGYDSISLTITQPLWDGYATRSRVRTGEATVDSVKSRVFDNATTFALDSIIAHADVLRARKIVELARANVLQHEQILASQTERVALGASTAADESQTQGRLIRAKATLTTSESALREAETVYARLTGHRAPEYMEPLPMPAGMFDAANAVLQAAEVNNPKIKAYQYDIKAMVGEKELAESAFHPRLNIEAGPSHTNRHGPGNQWTRELGASLVMRWNLFNSGADDAAVKSADARIRQSRATLLNLMDDLQQEIVNTWTRYVTAVQVRNLNEEAIGFNTATRDAYMEQFNLGQRSLLDVLDAESELFSSATEYVTSSSNVLIGAYRLEALAGTMLPNMDVNTDAFTAEMKN